MPSLLFTLLFGLLIGISAFVGRVPFEAVLMLGLIALTHIAVVSERQASELSDDQIHFGN